MHCKICDKSFTGPVSFQQHEASEKHKKKVKLYQDTTAGGTSQNTSTDNNSLLIPCTLCGIQLTGIVNFQAHVNSLQHADMIRKKSDGNIVSNHQSGDAPNEPEVTEVIQSNPGSNIPFYLSNAALVSYAQCEVCQKQFSGPAPYQQHLVSEVHKKKCILKGISIVPENQIKSASNDPAMTEDEINPGINVSPSLPNPILGSYAHCEICQKQFSGPAPYQQHLVSEVHKKKCILKGISIVPENQLRSATNEPAIAENETNPGINVSPYLPNPIFGSYAHCEVCQKQFSGPAPYQQHLVSEVHKKKCILKGISIVPPENQLKSASNEPAIAEDKINFGINVPVPENQMKITSNEQANSEAKDEINLVSNISFNFPNETLGSFAECKVCQKNFSGPAPFKQHLASELHKKKIIQKELSSISLDTVDSDKMSLVSHQEKVFVQCKSCNMRFSGPEPYQLHLDSAGHQKKIAVEQSSTLRVSENTNGVVSSLKCSICDKDFTGPIPYNDHLDSKTHKKKVQNVEFLKSFKSSISPEPDSSTPAPNYITEDVKINVESSGINREWYCEVCKLQMNGPDPYRQHIFGELHRKNNNSQNELAKDDRFKSNLFNYNNGDKTKDFHISNDLILCDALKNIGVVRPEDLNVTIFYPDDEVVFDNTMKKNNYNDKIISELNYE